MKLFQTLLIPHFLCWQRGKVRLFLIVMLLLVKMRCGNWPWVFLFHFTKRKVGVGDSILSNFWLSNHELFLTLLSNSWIFSYYQEYLSLKVCELWYAAWFYHFTNSKKVLQRVWLQCKERQHWSLMLKYIRMECEDVPDFIWGAINFQF
jgi:hypothetical protein